MISLTDFHACKQAQLSFNNATKKDAKDSEAVTTFTVDCGCSQEDLQTLVHAIYKKSIRFTSNNAYQLLATADFLQARYILLKQNHQAREYGESAFCDALQSNSRSSPCSTVDEGPEPLFSSMNR